MERLTKAEEELMHIIWRLGRCTVRDIIQELVADGQAEPPHSSISSIVRLIEKKGFVGHKAYGKTYEYFPLVDKASYGKKRLSSFLSAYFDGSPSRLVSFLVQEERLSRDELSALMKALDDADEQADPKP